MRTIHAALIGVFLLTFTPCISAQDTKEKAEKSEAKKDEKKEDEKKEVKTRELKVKEALTLKVPVNWETRPNANSMRSHTLATPTVKGETEKGEFTVFLMRSQDVNGNISRWVGQFQPDGRKHKIVKGKTDKGPYYFVDISGTYKKPHGPPFRRQTKDVAGQRMLGVILPVKGHGVCFLKLVGPDKGIKAQTKALRKSFDGDKETEKEYKTGE